MTTRRDPEAGEQEIELIASVVAFHCTRMVIIPMDGSSGSWPHTSEFTGGEDWILYWMK